MSGKYLLSVLVLAATLFHSCKSSRNTASEFRGFSMHQPKDAREVLFEETYIDAIKAEHVEKNIPKAIRMYEKCLELDDNNAAVMYKLGSLYIGKERYQEAEGLLLKATKLDPSNIYYKEKLIALYKKLNEGDKILKIYNDLIKLRPDHLPYYFDQANVYMVMKETDKALKLFEELEEKTGIIPQISQAKMRIFVIRNEFENAWGEGEKLISSDPQNKEYYGMLIDLCLSFGKEDLVAEQYKKILSFDPQDGKAQLVLADYYYRKNQLEESKKYTNMALQNAGLEVDAKISFLLVNYVSKGLDKYGDQLLDYADMLIETHPLASKPYAFRADILNELGKREQAIIDYRKALEYDKNNLILWKKVIAFEAEKRNFEKAIGLADEALDYFPNSPELYYFKGISANQLDDYKEAAQNLEDGLMFIIDDPELTFEFYTNLADIYNTLKKHDQSDTYFEKALQIRPDDAFILNNYAYYLALRNVELDKALEMSAKCLKADPESPSYLDTYGYILFLKGAYEESVKYLEKACDLKPYDADILEHLGDAYYRSGNIDAAIEKWEKAIRKGGNENNINQKISDGI